MCFCGVRSYPDYSKMTNLPPAPPAQGTLDDYLGGLSTVDLVLETIQAMSVEDYIELQTRINALFGTVMVND